MRLCNYELLERHAGTLPWCFYNWEIRRQTKQKITDWYTRVNEQLLLYHSTRWCALDAGGLVDLNFTISRLFNFRLMWLSSIRNEVIVNGVAATWRTSSDCVRIKYLTFSLIPLSSFFFFFWWALLSAVLIYLS